MSGPAQGLMNEPTAGRMDKSTWEAGRPTGKVRAWVLNVEPHPTAQRPGTVPRCWRGGKSLHPAGLSFPIYTRDGRSAHFSGQWGGKSGGPHVQGSALACLGQAHGATCPRAAAVKTQSVYFTPVIITASLTTAEGASRPSVHGHTDGQTNCGLFVRWNIIQLQEEGS